jgi:hypothetical protein
MTPQVDPVPTTNASSDTPARPVFAVLSALILSASLLASCGGGGGGSSSKAVQVRLTEYQLTPDIADAKSGKFGIDVNNAGTLKHELVLVRADSLDQLPKRPDGSVDEDKIPETNKLGETGEFAPTTTKTINAKLPAGNYVMFCNIIQTTNVGAVSHFVRGMHAQISVT